MPAPRPKLPPGNVRLVDVLEPSSGHFVVVVRADGLLPKDVPDFGTTIESFGVAPKEYAGRFDGYVLTDTRPDESGTNLLYYFEKLAGNTLTGQQAISQFGGGVVTTTEQRVVPGTTAAGGLKVVSSAVVPDGAGRSIKREVKLPDAEDWPELREPNYIPELGIFVDVYKKVVANTGQAGSATGGTGAADRVVVEYQPIDKWKTIQITSKVDFADIGASTTFRKPIQYQIPDEIPSAPTIIKAYAFMTATPEYQKSSGLTEDEFNSIRGLLNQRFLTDSALDYTLIEGRRGTFTAEVTRTLSMTAATEEEYVWLPRAENKALPVTLPTGATSRSRGKIVRFQTPRAIHGAWDIPVADVYSQTGSRHWQYDDTGGVKGALLPGYPKDFAYGETIDATATMFWQTATLFSASTINLTADATTPAAVPRGETIIAAVNSEKWRFGLWVNDVYRIVVPEAA